MFCTKCGASNPDGSKFCSNCGNALMDSVAEATVQPETPTVETAPDGQEFSVAEEIPAMEEFSAADVEVPVAVAEAPADSKPGIDLAELKAKGAALLEKAAPLIEKVKPLFQNKMVVGCIAAALVLLITVCVIVGALNSGNGYTDYEHFVNVVTKDDTIYIVRDNKVTATKIEANYPYSDATSIDGNVFAFLTENDELVVVNGNKAVIAAEEVESFRLSVNGNGIAFISNEDDYALSLYNIKSKKTTEITEAFSGYEYAISPDGKSVLYNEYDEDDKQFNLMYFNGKKSTKVASEVELVGLSNGGKYIYAYGYSDNGNRNLYAYNTKGSKVKLGNCDSNTFRFNEEMTQVLFYNEGKAYISSKGKEAVKISNSSIYPLVAPNASSFNTEDCVVYPVGNLYGITYTGYDGNGNRSVWFIHKNSNRSCKLVSDVSSVCLDASAEYLYYLNDDSELCVLKISHGDSASDKAKVLAEDVSSYVITSDRSKAYFTSDGGLYSCNGKTGRSKKTIVSDDVDTALVISKKDVVFYYYDGEVYACSNGRKGTKINVDAEYVSGTPNGIVYASNDDTLFVSTGSKRFTKLFEME